MEIHRESNPLLSIHMQSNRPDNFIAFLDRLEESLDDPSCIEVIVKIDDYDGTMNDLLPSETLRRRVSLKYISTPLPDGFYGLWRSMNEMLQITHAATYFILNLNDEMYFETPGWDTTLRRYLGLFTDDIFRLRTSVRRHHNYYDFWEAGFANDTSAIMTKRWIEIGGNWCPCNGPDSFQQCVAFYLGYNDRFNHSRPVRELPIEDIRFSFQGASAGLEGDSLRRRHRGAIAPWFRLMSHEMQEEASRRAEKLRAYIWAHANGIEHLDLVDNRRSKRLRAVERVVPYRTNQFRYGLSRARIFTTNARRFFNFGYYGGGGRNLKGPWVRNLIGFLLLRYQSLDWVRNAYYDSHDQAQYRHKKKSHAINDRPNEPSRISSTWRRQILLYFIFCSLIWPYSFFRRMRRIIGDAQRPLCGAHSRQYEIAHGALRRFLILPLAWVGRSANRYGTSEGKTSINDESAPGISASTVNSPPTQSQLSDGTIPHSISRD